MGGEDGFGGVAAIGEAAVGGAPVAFVEAGDVEDGTFHSGPAEVKALLAVLREGAAGEPEGGAGGVGGVGEGAEVGVEELDFAETAGLGFDGFGGGGEVGEGGGSGGGWARVGKIGLCGWIGRVLRGGREEREGEFGLVGGVEGPGFEAAVAKGAGEIGGEAVKGEDAGGLHELDEAEEVGVVGVIGEGEGGVALVAVNRARIESPAGDDGGTAVGDFFKESRVGGLGRTDDDVAGELGGIEGAVGREGEAEFFVNLSEPKRLRVEHRGERGAGEGGKEFLAFTEGVAEEDGGVALVEGGAAEAQEIGEDLGGGREDVVGAAVGGLHDEHVGARGGAGFGGEPGAEFEITGVEEAAVGGVGEEGLGGAKDVAGRVEGDGGIGGEGLGAAEGKDVFGAFGGHAGAHEAGGTFGEEDLAVGGEVIEVGVRDEGARDGLAGIEPPVDLGQVNAVSEANIPGHDRAGESDDGIPDGVKAPR